MMPEVKVLCAGRIRRDGKTVLEAHSTSSLIVCGDVRIVVDTSSRENRSALLSGLHSAGLSAGSVDILVNTHSHYDHTANNDLFAGAKLVAGPLPPGAEEFEIAPGARLVPTPGHTVDSISVFVASDKRYAIVGDAIPTQDNFVRWVAPGVNYDERVALGSMGRIARFAQVIVPGHGPAFVIDR
jgi:N-acyl homoserine lactone hydrolase